MDKDSFCLYPIYLDSSRPYSRGRKYPLNKCLPQPTSQEIQLALNQLEIQHNFDDTKRHPRDPFVYGRFSIKKSFDKAYIIKGLASVIKENRVRKVENEKKKEIKAETQTKKEVINANNPLGLQPKKKKKGKK
ncbi:signal recognition particle Srp19 [Tubulinosema ratisbonensis]|uniref:Signal recognition particle Srp19 n=1 Tax=Tubulinosema ratisbonensis TaxID=291195 RepID=A0A437AJ51_9MICR|nr:signal recognition particle Srp19 [Tubulinosema ratisbonensis]